jgi:hypothetical protein
MKKVASVHLLLQQQQQQHQQQQQQQQVVAFVLISNWPDRLILL